MRSALLRPMLLAVTLLCAACATSTRVQVPAAGCSTLVPERWTEDTESAVLADTGDPEADWQVFGVQQTGQLEISNSQKRGGFEIIRRCEARDAAAYRKVNAAWWQFWL